MLLFFIRHGDPNYETDSLTPLGRRQAEAVAKRMANIGIDKIYSSPLNRAYETAVPLSELIKKGITIIDFLSESNAWKYFSIPDESGNRKWVYQQNQIKNKFISEDVSNLGYNWYKHPEFKQYNFREGIEFFDKNIDEFLYNFGYEHSRIKHNYTGVRENNERIAVFSHEGIGSVFLSSLLDIPYPIFVSHYAMSHTGVTVIEFDKSGINIIPQIFQFSNDSHLYKEGLPTNYNNIIPI